MIKIIKKIFNLLLFTVILLGIAITISPLIRELSLRTGVLKEEIYISGTGSMYPTFPKSEDDDELVKAQEIVAWPEMRRFPSDFNLFGITLSSYNLSHGDIVEFENEKTDKLTKEKYGQSAGFVKRIIALPNDTVELRDGFVYLNGSILDEPYTAKPRSTYGGELLSDCKVIKIPKDNVFVLGDNRKASLDSRHELGLVDFADIRHVLPWSDQGVYRSLWRDTSSDLKLAHKASIDSAEFIRLLNQERSNKQLKSLRNHPQLSNSSKRRGDAMIRYNDFSNEATKSGVDLKKAISASGYYNILFAEVSTRGFYEVDELLENFLAFPDTEKILFSSQYQDIGIEAVFGEIDNCPIQVIVSHLGGYIPPNYTKEEIDSWQKLVNNLINEVIPSLEGLKGVERIDQKKLSRLLNLLNLRLNNAELILSKMKRKQWLTERERKLTQQDSQIVREAEEIISSFAN